MSIQPINASNTQYALQTLSPASQGTAAARKAEAAPDTAAPVQDIQALAQNGAVQPSSEQLTQAVKQIQDVIKQNANGLQFSIDEDVGVPVVKVIDTESKKVIRQIPSQEVLEIAKALDKLQGLLVKQQA
ncbi:flagellar protein FlaG [Zoogloea dura]|uniref:Flagellar protein FlaG n=1 Tax=Zoogloea dura TaxID=2728840 RepID=A0A848G1T5_9RHOO|nr:flagellar protein FlaG [Zoogloea dura]NML24995.1 flagellar protein FlaG [Zoogloea dura]